MIKKIQQKIFVLLVAVFCMTTFALAGSFTPNPSDPSSSHYTLENIYSKITTGTEASSGAHSFNPSTIPAPTYHTLENIWNSITWRSLDNTGTIQAGFYATSSLLIADANLVSSKIATGTNIFGVEGGCVSIIPSLRNGMVGYWPMDEVSGATANDNVGTNNGTLLGGITAGVTGVVGNAMQFDGGAGHYINLNASKAPSGSGSFSVAAWVWPEAPGHGLGLNIVYIGKNYSGDAIYDLSVQTTADGSTGSYAFQTYGGTCAAVKIYNGADIYGKWSHVVGVYDGSSYKLYVNGELAVDDITCSGINVIQQDFWIGYREHFGGNPFLGKMDEVGIWNRPLTQTDVTSLYNQGFGRSLVQ